jgi:Tfp pilus assembly protein PilO
MDSLWQQHRTFILKLLGGLAVVLVCWIVGASMAEKSLSEEVSDNASLRRSLGAMQVPADEDIRAYQDAVDRLTGRLDFLAARIGETRKGDELRRGLIEEILASVNADTPANLSRYLDLSRTAPVACVVGLRGVARDQLAARAGLENVILPDEVIRIAEMEMSQVDRYLLTIKLVVEVVKIAIDVGLAEIKQIKWSAPSGGRFGGEDLFVREYPVSIELRGAADAMLSFIERVTGPDDFIAIREMSKCGTPRSERDQSMVTAEFEFMAIRIDPDAGLRE